MIWLHGHLGWMGFLLWALTCTLVWKKWASCLYPISIIKHKCPSRTMLSFQLLYRSLDQSKGQWQGSHVQLSFSCKSLLVGFKMGHWPWESSVVCPTPDHICRLFSCGHDWSTCSESLNLGRTAEWGGGGVPLMHTICASVLCHR
jgi:hypothetical protein